MQLNNSASLKSALSLATCTLLCANTYAEPSFSVSETVDDVELKASNTLYAEENRVVVDETIVSIKKEIDDDEYVKATVIVDVMSGPSPNGLPPIKKPEEADTISSPSGSQTNPTSSKEQTFAFEDTRGALSLEWEKPLSRLFRTVNGISFSSEYDYTSVGLSGSFSKETDDRFTTFTSGVAYTYDIIKPVGGAPSELTSTELKSSTKVKYKSEYDFLIGATQVLTRSSLLQANYVFNYKKGYLTDPYKLVVFLDDDDLAPKNFRPYFHEKRPDSRNSHIVYFSLIQNINDNVLKLSYRYFDDSWGVYSHSTEVRYLVGLNEKSSIQFKYRYHTQRAAYFYHYHLVDGAADGVESRDIVNHPTDLKYVSADYRLGNLRSQAVGIKLSHYFLNKNLRADFRVDRIVSEDKKSGEHAFATVRAWVFQLAAKLKF